MGEDEELALALAMSAEAAAPAASAPAPAAASVGQAAGGAQSRAAAEPPTTAPAVAAAPEPESAAGDQVRALPCLQDGQPSVGTSEACKPGYGPTGAIGRKRAFWFGHLCKVSLMTDKAGETDADSCQSACSQGAAKAHQSLPKLHTMFATNVFPCELYTVNTHMYNRLASAW